jgi:hypothetical protein
MGQIFEQASTEFLTETQNKKHPPFTFTQLGKWWFKDNEIDLIAINEEKLTTTFFEVKWSTLTKRDSERTLKNLKDKAQLFRWNRKKESFGIIAKKIAEKQNVQNQGYLAFDLEDFEKL